MAVWLVSWCFESSRPHRVIQGLTAENRSNTKAIYNNVHTHTYMYTYVRTHKRARTHTVTHTHTGHMATKTEIHSRSLAASSWERLKKRHSSSPTFSVCRMELNGLFPAQPYQHWLVAILCKHGNTGWSPFFTHNGYTG